MSSESEDTFCYTPFKKYESILNDKSENFENKVQSLIEVWKSISELNFSQFDIKYIIQIIDWAKLHALNIVLTGEWRSTKESFRDELLEFIEKAQESLASVSDAFSTRCQKLADVVKKPWEDPILYNLIHDREAKIGSKEIEFFCVETGYLVSVRLKKLCENHCEDLALNLVTNYLKCKRQAAIQNFNLNATETQLWFIFDIYVALLYKFHDKSKILEQFGELEIPEGVQLIKRFAKKRVKISKIWRNCHKIAIFGSRYFLSKTLYKYNNGMKEYLTDLLKSYIALSNTETLLEEFVVSVRNLTNLADAEGLCIMCEVTHREAADRLRTFAIEMYIRALTTDMNELERLKHVNEEDKMKTTTSRLAHTFSNLAELLDDHVKVARECVLTAFSLEPTKERLKQIEELAKRSGFPVLDTGQEWKCSLHPPVLPSDDLAWVCPECGEWMCKPELTTPLQMNTPLQEALQESVLGISEALCDDLVVCLSNPRYQILSWLLSWGDLYRLCILYMNDPEKTKNFVTELKFVDVDYSMFEHIKREPVDEYTGIEKGYEQYLDLDFVSDEETSSVSEDSTSHDRCVSLGSDGTGDSFPPLPQPKSDPNTLKSLRMFRPNLKRKKEESGSQTKDKKVAVQIHSNSSSTSGSFGNLTSRSTITSNNYLPEDAGVSIVGTSAAGNFSAAYDYSAKPDRSLYSNEAALMLPSTSTLESLINHSLPASIIPEPVNSVFNTTNLSSVTSTSYVSNIIKSSLTFGVPKVATETPPNVFQRSIHSMQNDGSGIKQSRGAYYRPGPFAPPNAVAKKNTTPCSSKQEGTFITPSTIIQKNPKTTHQNQSTLTASSSKNMGPPHGSVGKNATHIVNDLDALLKEVVKDIDADSNQTVITDSKNGVAATLPQLGGQVANTHKQLIQVPQQQSCSLSQMQTKSLPEMSLPNGTKDACKMKLTSNNKRGKLIPNGEISGLAKKRKQTEESSISPGKDTFKIMELSVKIPKLNPEEYNKSQGRLKLVGKPSERTESIIPPGSITKQSSSSSCVSPIQKHTRLLKQQNALTTPPPKLSQALPKQLENHISPIETPVTLPNHHPKCPPDHATQKKVIIMQTASNQPQLKVHQPPATVAVPQNSLKPEHSTPLQAKSQLQIEDSLVVAAAITPAAAVPQIHQIAVPQESPTSPCQKVQCSSPREAIQADSRARSQKVTVLTIRKSHPAANVQRLLVVAQEKVKEILAKASFLQEPYKSTIKPLQLQDIFTARKKKKEEEVSKTTPREVCSLPSNRTMALSICRDSSTSLAVTTTDCDKDKVHNYDKKTDSTEIMQNVPSKLEKTDQPEFSVESKVSSLEEKKRNTDIIKQIRDDWEESNTHCAMSEVVVRTDDMASEKKMVSMSDNKNRGDVITEVGTCSTRETMENVNKSLGCDNRNGTTDLHNEVAADECDSNDSLIELVEWFECTLKTNTKDKRENRNDNKYIETKVDNSIINVVDNRNSDLMEIQNHDQTSEINSIHLDNRRGDAKEYMNNQDTYVYEQQPHDHINSQNITFCEKARSLDSEELIQIQAVITKESVIPKNAAQADRIDSKTPTGCKKVVTQTIVKAVNDGKNVKNTRLRITLQQQKAIKSKDKKCCKDVVFEPPASKIRLAIKKDPDVNKENIKKCSSHATPQAGSRFKILVDKHVHASRKRKCDDELEVEKKGYNPKRQLIVPLKRLPEVVARPNVKVLVTDPFVSIEDDLYKKTMPLADCNVRNKVKKKMDVKNKKRHAKDLPNTSIGRGSGFHLSIYEDKFYSMLAQVNRLSNSGSMRIPGLNDYSAFLPRNVNHVVNVVQHTVPRSSTVTNQNTQTSTQVTPHIQRIGQPKLPECSKPDHYEEDLEQAPSSSTVTSSTPSTSQSSTLINILSSPKPGQKCVQSRQTPYVNILSQQILRPTTSSIVPPTTTTSTATTTATTVIKVEPEDRTEVQATKSVNSNVRIVTTTTQAGAATTSSTPAQGGTILQFICKSSSLPKFQQAFGKTVYQTGGAATPSEGTSETSEVSTNEISNQSQQTTTTTVVETKKIAAKSLPINVQPLTGNVIFRGQVPVGQTVSLIPPGSNTRQLFRITGSTHEQISLVKETVIQNKMSALLAAALQGKPKITEQNGELVEEYSATRITLCRPGSVPPNATRIVKPVQLQIPANVIRAPQPNVSSTTLEQLREFDMVYKQVKERSSNPAQPETSAQSGQEAPHQQPQQQQQRISFTYVNQVQKYTQLSPVVVVSSYSPIQQQSVSPALSVVSQAVSGPCLTQVSTVAVPKVAVKSSKGKSIKSSVAKTCPTTIPAAIPKPQQKPQEDEHTTQRIFDILAEYAEQLRNSPDLNNKPAPRRRSNPPTNPSSNTSSSSSSKKKKKKSGTSTSSNLVETDNEDLTMGSEDSSGGNVVQLSMTDEEQSQSASITPPESNLEPATSNTPTPRPLIVTDSSNQPRNVIIADSSVGEALKMPNTALLMPGNYIMPVSVVKGGQQIAVVSGGSKILTTVPARSGQNMLLFQSFVNQNKKGGISAVKYSSLQPFSGPSSQNMQGVTAHAPLVLPSNSVTTMALGQPITLKKIDDVERRGSNTELLLTISQPRDTIKLEKSPDVPQPDSSTSLSCDTVDVKIEENSSPSDDFSSNEVFNTIQKTNSVATSVIASIIKNEENDCSHAPSEQSSIIKVEEPSKQVERIGSVLVNASSSNGPMLSHTNTRYKKPNEDVESTTISNKEFNHVTGKVPHQPAKIFKNNAVYYAIRTKKTINKKIDSEMQKQAAIERELRLQKTLSEECEDLGVDEPSTSDLFPEADLLFDSNHSPSYDQSSQKIHGPAEAKAKDSMHLFSDYENSGPLRNDLFDYVEYHTPPAPPRSEPGIDQMNGNNASNESASSSSSSSSSCDDSTLLSNCGTMSEVTLNSPISLEYSESSHTINKYKYKYTNRKKGEKVIKLHSNIWQDVTSEVTSSEDAVELVKEDETPIAIQEETVIEEAVTELETVVLEHPKMPETDLTNRCPIHSSVDSRGSRKTTKKTCSCLNGSKSPSVCSAKRRVTFPKSPGPTPSKKLLSSKRR